VTEPLISLVCSTVGRPDALDRLLDSLAASPLAERIELVVVDQSAARCCARLVERRPPPGPWTIASSARGASVGRNVGLVLATGPVVAFPDDNCWYAPDTVPQVLQVLRDRPGLAGLSGRQLTAAGNPSMLRWLTRPTLVTRRNFLRTTICSTLFIRRDALTTVGPFDETIGVGAPGWVGAGEESDLVLRLLAAGHVMDYRPDIVVYQDDDRDAPTERFVEKMLRYGVGQGHLWRRHRLSVGHLLYLSARKLAGSGVRALRGRTVLARADLAYLRGTVAGWRGVAP
jgi:glycosyltransferase involved in cell wall biosynthesis